MFVKFSVFTNIMCVCIFIILKNLTVSVDIAYNQSNMNVK